MLQLVYFSTRSGNTHYFVSQLGKPINLATQRIPLSLNDAPLTMACPFILISPTYADGEGKGAVPKPVIQFLNNPINRGLLKGVIASGNRSFGRFYGYAGDVIAQRCGVPVLYKFELRGTPEDVEEVKQIFNNLSNLWRVTQDEPYDSLNRLSA